MSDEPKPEDEVPVPDQEAPAETKSGKKSKADKKKAAAQTQTDEEAPAPVPAESEAAEPVDQLPASTLADRPAAAPPAASGGAQDLFQQGIQALLRGEYDAADNLFGQALTTYRKQGDRAGQIDVLEQLGHLCFLRGAEAQAREYYQQANLMRAV